MKLRLTASAQRDIEQTLNWSADNFGAAARQRYQRLIGRALLVIRDNDPPTSRDAGDIDPSLRLYHLRSARSSASADRVAHPRHFIVYRRDSDWTIVLRIPHGASDLPSRFQDG